MSDFLRSMAAGSLERASALPRTFSAAAFDRPAVPLKLGAFDLIAEIKERSPSAGELASGPGTRLDRARQYLEGGAAAISVLTEPSSFGGDLSHLREVAAAVSGAGIPVMRKDFLMDVRQLLEARAAGASGVLLIVAMLDDRRLADMLDCAFEHALFVLLEAFDEDDVARTIRLLGKRRCAERAERGQLLVGVNSRNLRTLAVDPGRLARLAPLLPDAAVSVAESGLENPGDAALVSSLGYRVALVGTALMREGNPGALIGEMLVAGRAAAAAQKRNSIRA
jgi:indole-3-glycerol phosphate synthase